MPRTLHRTPVPSAYDDCEFSLTDLFCGGGGSSFGAEQVPGVRSVMAVNHWDLAVETHNRNMPDAGHDVIDIARADPSRFPAPTCCGRHPAAPSSARPAARNRPSPSPRPSPACSTCSSTTTPPTNRPCRSTPANAPAL